MLLLAIVYQVTGAVPVWVAGLAGWLAAPLLIGRIARGQRIQVSILLLLGLLALAWAAKNGDALPITEIIIKNHALLAMLAAVSFLRLVSIESGSTPSALPEGTRAYLRTLGGLALLGSVINISSLLLIADRLHDRGALVRFASRSLTRVFSGCSGWSPFYGGMAVVITYVASANLGRLVLLGLPFALAGLALTAALALIFERDKVRNFRGYPMDFRNLWLPAALAVAVFAINRLLPQASILIHIALGALLVSGVALSVRHGPAGAAQRMAKHVTHGLPGQASELYLFLAAGVLAVGLFSALSGSGFSLPISSFDERTAMVVLAAMVLLSMVGVHPVIPITTLTAFLMPLNPQPDLLALTYLLGWSLGTCASPLSGTHIIMQARYDVPSWQAAVANWPFVAIMYVLACALLWFTASVILPA